MLHCVPESPSSPESFARLVQTGLTPRECEVLTLVAEGRRNADIARVLAISPKTVGKHVDNLLFKLNVDSRAAAVSMARERLRRLGDTAA
jgi:DNA-binding NarL/FixJ family response regulator